MTHGKAVQHELREPTRALRRKIPGVYEGYAQLHAAAFTPGALDAKTKEAIALAIAVTEQCDDCIASHARAAARHGVTSAEVAEALGVAIALNGGPGTVYAARAFAAFQEFAESATPVTRLRRRPCTSGLPSAGRSAAGAQPRRGRACCAGTGAGRPG